VNQETGTISSMASTFALQSVSPAQLVALQAELRANGGMVTTLSPNQYQIVGHGVTADAAYDPATKVLTVTVVSKPFYVSIEEIETGLQKALQPPAA